MTLYTLGTLRADPAAEHPELVSTTVGAAIEELRLGAEVGVVEIDPELSDTATTQVAYDLSIDTLANCVIVGGRRGDEQRHAAAVVLASTRVDVNSVVRKRLDVRKASFLGREEAIALSGMEYGAITPIGMPAGWPVLVDSRVIEAPLVIVGSGIRRSKLILPGALLQRVPGVEVVEGLGRPVE